MSKNYYISRVARVDIKDLVGTRNFTAGKKVFTFVMPIAEFLYQYDSSHLIYDENLKKMHVNVFCSEVLEDCDKVIYEKGKP